MWRRGFRFPSVNWTESVSTLKTIKPSELKIYTNYNTGWNVLMYVSEIESL